MDLFSSFMSKKASFITVKVYIHTQIDFQSLDLIKDSYFNEKTK